MTVSVDALVKRLEEVSPLRRLPHFWTLYSGFRFIGERTKGVKESRRNAWQFACLVIAPEWLADRLTARWKRQKSAGQAAVPIGSPAPLRVLQ